MDDAGFDFFIICSDKYIFRGDLFSSSTKRQLKVRRNKSYIEFKMSSNLVEIKNPACHVRATNVGQTKIPLVHSFFLHRSPEFFAFIK